MIDNILKNQKYLFGAIFGGLTLVFICWYFLIQKGLSEEYNRTKREKKSLSVNIKESKRLKTKMSSLESEWNLLSDELETIINRIPDKRLYDSVLDYVYTLVINKGLVVQNFSPSKATLDRKTFLMPENGDEVIIEKIPIDIVLRGSFLNFGKLLESMRNGKYRLTAVNIDINQKKAGAAQEISLICFAYFKTVKRGKVAQNTLPKIKKVVKNNPEVDNQNTKKENEIASVIDVKKTSLPDSIEGVPEMWLEPATEPVEESTQEVVYFEEKKKIKKEIQKTKIEVKSEDKLIQIEDVKLPEAENVQLSSNTIEILTSKVCKKVKNNQPLYPGKRFPSDIGKVYCHSLLNNHTGKYKDIYHIWYMNDNLKAKVRIRVREGGEIPAVSQRQVAKSDKGTWRIEITDSDKKILDTVIFEVV
jgi:Tfp pilus assembly protein PilO